MSAEVEAAVRAGKFPAHRAPHYETLMGADPVGTRQLLDAMTTVVPVGEVGAITSATPAPLPAAEASYPKEWLTATDKAKTEHGGRVVIGND